MVDNKPWSVMEGRVYNDDFAMGWLELFFTWGEIASRSSFPSDTNLVWSEGDDKHKKGKSIIRSLSLVIFYMSILSMIAKILIWPKDKLEKYQIQDDSESYSCGNPF